MPPSDDSVQIFVKTGDSELDRLLAPDTGKEDQGLPIGRAKGGPLCEANVILLEGGAGLGKTTLALQIASHAAHDSGCRVVFLSLEQLAESLLHAVANFGFPKEVFAEPPFAPCAKTEDMVPAGNDMQRAPRETPATPSGTVLLCRLSPLPLSHERPEEVFNTRFAELENIIAKFSPAEEPKKLFVLDCLNAFTGSPLTRSQLYQLFTLFRSHRIPLLATLEQPERPAVTAAPLGEIECFLADIVIKLTREPLLDHLQFYLEISKSRVGLQGLGKHLFKTRTASPGVTPGRERTGIVVYPSVHFMVSQARRESPAHSVRDYKVGGDLKKVLLEKTIDRPACFAVMGPAGTHKLAIGLNLSLGYVKKKAKLLIIAFGGQGDIDFKGVAWTPSRQYLRKLAKSGAAQDAQISGKQQTAAAKHNATTNGTVAQTLGIGRSAEGTKSHVIRYEVGSGHGKDEHPVSVTVLTFHIGMLTPEECLFGIQEHLRKGAFTSVLLCDTAELCTGFPLLSRDTMFFAAMLDVFESQRLVTVGIGVEGTEHPALREINLALTARASHRLALRHFPDVTTLMANKISSGAGGKARDEQLISVVIDNVTGKHYRRSPTWVHVKEIKQSDKDVKKTLGFSSFGRPPKQARPTTP